LTRGTYLTLLVPY